MNTKNTKSMDKEQNPAASRDDRMNAALDAAFMLFAQNGIDTVRIEDVAAAAHLGVASMYRYFATKDNLAIETACRAVELRLKKYIGSVSTAGIAQLNGFRQLEMICISFAGTLEAEGDFYRFIYYFDSYAHRRSFPEDQLAQYESKFLPAKNMVVSAINTGIADGSIRCTPESGTELYFTIMHALFSMMQKLSLSGNLLAMDKETAPSRQIELLTKLLLASIAGRKN